MTGASVCWAPPARSSRPMRVGHLLDQRRVPGGGEADRLRVADAVAAHHAVQRLLVDDGRDAQPGALDEVPLDGVREAAHPRAAPRLVEPTTRVTWPMPCAIRSVRLGRVEGAVGEDLERPEGAHLGELLVERHPREQVLRRAPSIGARRVAVGRDRVPRARSSGRRVSCVPPRRRRHPLTAPAVRPPDDLALGEDVEQERGDHRQRGEREDARGVRACTACEKFMTPSGKVHLVRRAEDHERQQERVPAAHDARAPRRWRVRACERRQHDAPEEPERGAAVDARRILQLHAGWPGRTAAG